MHKNNELSNYEKDIYVMLAINTAIFFTAVAMAIFFAVFISISTQDECPEDMAKSQSVSLSTSDFNGNTTITDIKQNQFDIDDMHVSVYNNAEIAKISFREKELSKLVDAIGDVPGVRFVYDLKYCIIIEKAITYNWSEIEIPVGQGRTLTIGINDNGEWCGLLRHPDGRHTYAGYFFSVSGALNILDGHDIFPKNRQRRVYFETEERTQP